MIGNEHYRPVFTMAKLHGLIIMNFSLFAICFMIVEAYVFTTLANISLYLALSQIFVLFSPSSLIFLLLLMNQPNNLKRSRKEDEVQYVVGSPFCG